MTNSKQALLAKQFTRQLLLEICTETDEEGVPLITVACHEDLGTFVYFNQGNGVFDAGQKLSGAEAVPYSLVAADLNGDGLSCVRFLPQSPTELAFTDNRLPLPAVSISVWFFGRTIHDRSESIQEQLSTLSAVVQETLSGVRVVRAYGQEPFEIERFRAANEEYVRRSRLLVRLEGMYFPSMGLLMGIGALVVIERDESLDALVEAQLLSVFERVLGLDQRAHGLIEPVIEPGQQAFGAGDGGERAVQVEVMSAVVDADAEAFFQQAHQP